MSSNNSNYKKQYPKKYHNNNNVMKPMSYGQKTRYKKGFQNQLVNASRRTETHTKDKTTIVTETINVVDFNTDSFEYVFGNNRNFKKRN